MKQINNLPILGFGAMRLPDNFDESEKLVLRAIEKGVNYFDVAYIYTGKEALLGKILHKNSLRKQVSIATKLPLFLCKNPTDFDKFFYKQLSRLKTDYVDYYLLHMLNSPNELSELFAMGLEKWIISKKQTGEIKQIGFSFHGKAHDFITLTDAYNWDFCMIQYNYLDINNQAGINGLKHAYSKGIPIIVMEPLRGGLLAEPKGFPPKVLKLFGETPPARYALKWLWNHEEISCVLSGMCNMSQLEDNIAVANESFPGCMTADELELIEKAREAFNELNRIPCTGCDYCMPCPVGVNIPGCFAAYNDFSAGKKKQGKGQYLLNTGVLHSKNGVAGACVNCGKCEPRCPQEIPIATSLKEVSRKMEPFWFKLSMSFARKFITGKKTRGQPKLN